MIFASFHQGKEENNIRFCLFFVISSAAKQSRLLPFNSLLRKRTNASVQAFGRHHNKGTKVN